MSWPHTLRCSHSRQLFTKGDVWGMWDGATDGFHLVLILLQWMLFQRFAVCCYYTVSTMKLHLIWWAEDKFWKACEKYFIHFSMCVLHISFFQRGKSWSWKHCICQGSPGSFAKLIANIPCLEKCGLSEEKLCVGIGINSKLQVSKSIAHLGETKDYRELLALKHALAHIYMYADVYIYI